MGCCPESTFGYRCVAGDDNGLSKSPETSGLVACNFLQEDQPPKLSISIGFTMIYGCWPS